MRGVFSTWCALGAAAVIFAAEAPPSPLKSRTDSDESLATVKRDFEAIKSAREATGKSSVDLPRLTAPELQTEVRRPAAPKAPAPVKKSANWLVDAVEASKPGARGEQTPEENAGALAFSAETRTENDAGPTQRGKARPTDRKTGQTTETVVNPLTSFMAGWMTPQDLALLRPGMGGPTAAESISRGERPREFAEQSASGVSPGKGSELFATREKAPLVSAAPRVNPFLESIGSPAIAPMRAILPTPSRAPLAPAVEPIPAKSKVPEFAKPPEDEKYFKQLKRF